MINISIFLNLQEEKHIYESSEFSAWAIQFQSQMTSQFQFWYQV